MKHSQTNLEKLFEPKMAKTMCITQEGPANSLALNKDNSQVVIAGRNVFKVFTIEDNEFIENYNLRVGKNLNLNFSCNHVAWNSIEDNILATAATNGAVVLWNLGRPSRSKQEHVFNDHKRTVNKVCFHSTEPSLLLSGSQDGTMKCFDIKNKEVIRTFYSNAESVRDVQFSPHNSHIFTAVSENGNVQLWDLRKHDKYWQQFTAHSGPIFACDWHPELMSLATASRDKTIKVWDLTSKPTLDYIIHTIASIGHIKWRPQRRYHIASCALVVDCSINVWDVRRPYIPFASFDQHKDVATGVAWRGQPHVFLSTSRDCTLFQHVFRDALRPANSANPQSVSLNLKGDVAYACRTNQTASSKLAGLLKRPLSHSESFCQAHSALHEFTSKNRKDSMNFKECAVRYLLSGKNLAELCDHNAAVAKDLGKQHVSLVWGIIKTLYTYQHINKATDYNYSNLRDDFLSAMEVKTFNNNKLAISSKSGLESDDKSVRGMDTSGGGLDDETETDDTPEFQFGFSNTFMLKDFSTEFQMQGDFFFGDGESDPLSMDLLTSNITQEQDWTIQSEAFPLRHEIQEGSPQPETFVNQRNMENEMESSTLGIETPVAHITINFIPSVTQIDPSQLVVEALKHHANMGDVQTAVSILFVLGERRRDLTTLGLSIQEHWQLTYLDMLARHELWDVSAEIIQYSWIPSINQLNQQSTTIHTCCGDCNKPLQRTGWLCDKCHLTNCAVCSVCHQIVKGLFIWCQGCSHGGHLTHITNWHKNNKLCATGCGHTCEYG